MLGFEIGEKIQFANFTGDQYNAIGYNHDQPTAYQFDCNGLIVEVSTKDAVVTSFDILMRYQEGLLCIGDSKKEFLFLNSCKLDELLIFFNKHEIVWNFKHSMGQSIGVEVKMKRRLSLYFDFNAKDDKSNALSLLHID